MSREKAKKPPPPSAADKREALRIALERGDTPSGKFMKAFESLMRKEKDK